MESGDVDLNIGINSETPLHLVMWYNHPRCVALLMSSRTVTLDTTNVWGRTPLHHACSDNAPACIALYIQAERCTASIINMKSNAGDTALMGAVTHGNLDCVKEMENAPGVDFDTRNNYGDTLIEVARRHNRMDVLRYLEERNNSREATVRNRCDAPAERNDHTDTTETLSLREIAEELDNIKVIGSILLSEQQSMNQKQEEELEMLQNKQRDERTALNDKQKQDNETHHGLIMENDARRKELENTLQALLRPTNDCSNVPQNVSTPSIPECPVCLEEMRPPMQIFNCCNGHAICSICRARWATCTNCREPYLGRATVLEQMVREMLNMD